MEIGISLLLVITVALQDQEAGTIADSLVQGFISQFGILSQRHSDHVPQFENKLFQALCDLQDIEKTRTMPYHSQSDR